MTCTRLLLTDADGILLFSTCVLLRRLQPGAKIFKPVLWGLCLNPLLILLTVQQGNFDVIPAILILWFLIALIRFRRGGQPVDWLVAAVWLGLGAFAKTFPLVLAPLLFAESRRLDWKTRLLGAALCAGPALISLAPLLALQPHDVTAAVLLYRGTPGTLGVSGLLILFAGRGALAAYAAKFALLLLVALVAITVFFFRRPPRRDADLVLLAAILLLTVFIFGPGNSVQYWYWIAPLLVVAYLQYSRALTRVILIAAIVIVATGLLEFAYADVLGCIAYKITPAGINQNLHDWLNVERIMSGVCLPMTAISFLLWIFAVGSIIAPAENRPGEQ